VKTSLSLKTWLVVLVIVAVVPLLLFAAATVVQISQDAQRARDQGQADTAQALALAVDGEVRSWKAAATALAGSRALRNGRLAEFYEEAREVAAPHAGWIVLTVASGQQLLNTLLPYGAPLYKTSSPETIDTIFRDGKPIVSDVFYGKNAQTYLVAVAVPVLRDGKVVHCLTLNFSPDRLSRLLEGQHLPPSWVAAISDRERHVVARSHGSDQRIGRPLMAWLAAAVSSRERGIGRGPLIDHRPGQVAYQRLQEVPWAVTLAVPLSELPSSRPLVAFLLVGAGVGAGAIGAALAIGRKVAGPVARLAASGERMLRGDPVEIGTQSGIREVQGLQRALREASAAVRGYYEERERAAVAIETGKAVAASAEALRASEQRYRELVETAPDAVVVHRDGRFLYANPVAFQLYGVSSLAELQKQSLFDLLDPADRDLARARAGQVMAGRRTDRQEFLLRVAGEAVPVESISGPVELEGERAVQVVMRDITERKRAEAARVQVERLQGVIETAGAAAHELNQPLQVLCGSIDLLLLTQDPSLLDTSLQRIRAQAERMGEITRALGNITQYETKPYCGTQRILDIRKASGSTEQGSDGGGEPRGTGEPAAPSPGPE
jgi:PAS domain S-box-containing protein